MQHTSSNYDAAPALSALSRHRRTLITSNRSPSKTICFTGFVPFSLAHFHPADFALGIADHQQHRERLRHPIFRVALLLEREDFRAVAPALAWRNRPA